MPPKKAKQGSAVIDGVDTSEMTREKLEQFTMRVKDELEKEREDRNFFQLERDKIRTFWEISRNQLEELRAEIRNKEREMEEGVEAAEAAAKTHSQRVKHLVLEHAGEKCALRADAQAALRAAHAQHVARETQLLKEGRESAARLREAELAAQEEMKRVKFMHHEELHNVRSEFEQRAREIEASAERRLQKSTSDLEVVRRTDLAEVEERKNKQLNELVTAHEKAFADLKNYYNDITLNNLGLISSLKSQMEEMQKSRERAEKAAADAIASGRKLSEPLNKALAEAAELKRRAHHHERDRAALASKTRILAALEKQHTTMKWDYEVLEQRFDKLVRERDEIQINFQQAVLELQQKAALKGALLEQRLKLMHLNDSNKKDT